MSTTIESTQVYQVFIKASAEQIWQAIVDPELTVQYFHGVRIAVTADERRSSMAGDGVANGSRVLEFDPPRRLVHEWSSYYDEEMAKEPFSRVTWEIEPQDGGYCLLTLVHDQLAGSPKTAASVGGRGWMFVLSGLKTLVETGKGLA
ncbi:MAG: ATPase [Hamadaea sp.]|nr:ATPase [Hamadaea sp.]NUR50042.1 ATPase [Hamadaea sp.]NUT07880.1 ATPase [Hamadaea sp.]